MVIGAAPVAKCRQRSRPRAARTLQNIYNITMKNEHRIKTIPRRVSLEERKNSAKTEILEEPSQKLSKSNYSLQRICKQSKYAYISIFKYCIEFRSILMTSQTG